MKITEDKLREITRVTIEYLGSNSNPEMVKKIVKEVIGRLNEDVATPKKISY